MRPPSIDGTRRVGTGSRIVMLLLPVFLVAGCSGSGKSSSPDLSTDGRLSYACALMADAIDEHGPVDSWDTHYGTETDPGLRRAVAATALVGSPFGTDHLHGDLSESGRTIFQGISRADLEVIQGGVDPFLAACEERDLPDGKPDVSDDGRITYACALVHDTIENHGPVDSWERGIGDGADDAYLASTAALGLLDGFVGDRETHGALSEAAVDGGSALATLRDEMLQSSLDAIDAACDD